MHADPVTARTPTSRSTCRADDDSHGGADHAIMTEFLEYVRHGGPTRTSPVAARAAVATGYAATESLRAGGVMVDIPPVPPDLAGALA